MAESWAFTSPQPLGPNSASMSLASLAFSRYPNWLIHIILKDDQNRLSHYYYRDAAAQTMITALNKANLGVKSLERRVIEQLVSDGKLAAGSVSGSPD